MSIFIIVQRKGYLLFFVVVKTNIYCKH